MLFPWQRNEELWVCINIAKHLIITFAYMKHTQTLKMFEYFRKICYQDVTVWQGNALGGYVSFGPDHIKNIEVGDFLLPASDTSMFVAYNKMCSETEWRCLILYLFSRYVWALANNNSYVRESRKASPKSLRIACYKAVEQKAYVPMTQNTTTSNAEKEHVRELKTHWRHFRQPTNFTPQILPHLCSRSSATRSPCALQQSPVNLWPILN